MPPDPASGTLARDAAPPSFEAEVPIGHWREIADGLFRISIPVPFRGLRQVNLWLLADRGGWTMIDCGWGDEQTRDLLSDAWRDILGGRPVTRLVVTHFHPDHMGNCGWISGQWKLLPQVTQTEWMAANLAVRNLYSDDTETRARFFVQNGIPPELLQVFHEGVILYHLGVDLPEQYCRIRDGDRIGIGGADWRVITGSGHSPEMATLYDAGRDVYIAGDQVLPKITSNVSVWPWEPLADPLGDFLSSLRRIAGIVPDSAIVLPSHRDPFRGPRRRIDELERHHEHRLANLKAEIRRRGEASAGECLGALFQGELDGHQVAFAMAEALAHLNYLVRGGEAERIERADGSVRFRLTTG
ncbi:MBL fold metallo-hydrolase [Faunimonas sp. B44]|uniref:MBL fold metallo-hydrolase n=1 Tax=Faunimonas sp. B44 TaxID=3461493 RepID=UPI004043A1A9